MEENVDSLGCPNVQSPDKSCQELPAQCLSGKGGVKGDSCQVPLPVPLTVGTMNRCQAVMSQKRPRTIQSPHAV